MKKTKILSLIVFFLCNFFTEAYSGNPKKCTPSALSVTIPWNQNSVSGIIPLNYSDFSCPYETYLTILGDSHFIVTVPPGENRPIYAYYTAVAPGTSSITTRMVWLDNSNNYYMGDLIWTNIVITKEPLPPTHGSVVSSVSRYVPGYASDVKVSGYITPGSTINWSLSLSTFNMQPGTTTANAFIGSALSKQLSVSNSGHYSAVNKDDNGVFIAPYGFCLELWTNVNVSSGGGGAQATSYISW
ncbi:MAG: hypothetical protein JXA06_08720 [Bacteroidetes bacterium]|nr:hypothetical protein [Bacteroidota bacterium]